MRIDILEGVGVDIEGVGSVRFGMGTEELSLVVGQPDWEFDRRREYKKFGCFIDTKPTEDSIEVVDAIEFWNDRAANVAEVMFADCDVLLTQGLTMKAVLESRNAAPPVDGWYVNLDVFVSGGDPTFAQQEIDRAVADGTFGDVREIYLEELAKATVLTSFEGITHEPEELVQANDFRHNEIFSAQLGSYCSVRI